MTNIISTTEQLVKKYHNHACLVDIVNAVVDGLDAQKRGDNAQIKLTLGVFKAFDESIDERGQRAISLTEAHAFCSPLADPAQEAVRQETNGKFLDGICTQYSAQYSQAVDDMEATKGAKNDTSAAKFSAAKNTKLAISNMFRRAIRTATMLQFMRDKTTNEAIKVKLSIRDSKLRVVCLDKAGEMFDAFDWNASDCIREADAFWPKSKRAEKTAKAKSDESEKKTDKGQTLTSSIAFIRKIVTGHTYNALSKDVRDDLQSLYAELTALFATKDNAAHTGSKKAKAA